MFFYEGLSCPHCHNAFREDDDIVSCPQCGAPHHRACWKELGGCACAATHGTTDQWSRDKQEPPAAFSDNTVPDDHTACPHCGEKNSPYAELCSGCGRELQARDWNTSTTPPPPPYTSVPHGVGEYTPFHNVMAPLGGIAPDTPIEGEKAIDLAAVVSTNTNYYLPRFQRMAAGSRISWNWAACLFPSFWSLYRKQYLLGAAVLAIQILLSVFSSAVIMHYFADALAVETYAEMFNEMMRLLQTSESAYLAGALISMLSFSSLFINVLLGALGNRLYMRRCVKLVAKTRLAYPEGYAAQLGLLGGTSIALVLIGYMIKEFLPMILLQLFV